MLTSIKGTWAVDNGYAIQTALRKALALTADEELRIIEIAVIRLDYRRRRALKSSSEKSEEGTRVDYAVGVDSQERMIIAESKSELLAGASEGDAGGAWGAGGMSVAELFCAALDEALIAEGKKPIGLRVSDIRKAPKKVGADAAIIAPDAGTDTDTMQTGNC